MCKSKLSRSHPVGSSAELLDRPVNNLIERTEFNDERNTEMSKWRKIEDFLLNRSFG